MQAIAEKLKDMGCEQDEPTDTTDGRLVSRFELKRLMLQAQQSEERK